jgi:hypothetical protein
MDITSPGVCVDGVEGAEFGEGPAVLAVPVLFAGPEDDAGCFLFLALGATFAAAFSQTHTHFKVRWSYLVCLYEAQTCPYNQTVKNYFKLVYYPLSYSGGCGSKVISWGSKLPKKKVITRQSETGNENAQKHLLSRTLKKELKSSIQTNRQHEKKKKEKRVYFEQ